MNKRQLRFLHLSDIHFKRKSELDPDMELQQALINDAEEVAEKLGGVDAVLVTGDIAFAGQEEQYEVATTWLKDLCKGIKADIGSVRTIPGNHDVNRDVLRNNPLLADVRDKLRDESVGGLDGRLKGYLENQYAQELLMQPTTAYNRFAGTLGCAILPGKLWWEENLELNDGSILRLHGLHSSLLCDHRDTTDVARHKMILGSAQVNLGHVDGVAHLAMCHHPFDWLRDADNARQALDAYASIQLFGHKHTFDLNTINNKVLRLGAGAVQPERDERGWEPRFNFLGVSVQEEGGRRVLQVEVWPLVWDRTSRRFQPDYRLGQGAESKTFDLELPAWRGRPKPPSSESLVIENTTKRSGMAEPIGQPPTEREFSPIRSAVGEQTRTSVVNAADNTEGEATMKAKRKLIHAYLSLSFSTIISIAVRLRLVRDEDEGVGEQELFNRFVERAEQEERLGELWDEVAQHELLPPNPFAASSGRDASTV